MNAHIQIAEYSERQLDALPAAATWQQDKMAFAELAKLGAPVAAYKATGSNEAWDAICEVIRVIEPELDAIRKVILFDLCSDADHYDHLAEDAIGGVEAAYEYAGVFQ